MKELLRRIPKLWNEFWFESNEAASFDLFRRLVALILFSCYLIRTFDLHFFYSQTGFLPASIAPESIAMDGRYSLLFWFPSDTALWIFHFVFLLSLLAMVFKILPRLSCIIAFILHVSFIHRTVLIAYGVDLISVFFLFYFCFSDFRPKAIKGDAAFRAGKDWRSSMGSVAYRMSQLHVCIIYAFAGCEKLKGSHWWQGQAAWDMMANIQIARTQMTWLAYWPSLIVFLTFATLIWEVYFPVLIWVKPLRPYVLLVGVLMHLVIMVTIDIPYFSLLMLASFILYVDREDWIKVVTRAPLVKKWLSV